MTLSRTVWPALAATLVILPAACAPQSAGTVAPPTATSLSSPPNAATQATMPMQGMQGMDHSNMPGMNMQGMDHNAMMAHCAEMRQQTRAGTAVSAGMRQMMAQCDQMDRSMGTQRGR